MRRGRGRYIDGHGGVAGMLWDRSGEECMAVTGMSEDRVRCQAGMVGRQSLVHVIQEFTLGAQSLGNCNRGSRCRY